MARCGGGLVVVVAMAASACGPWTAGAGAGASADVRSTTTVVAPPAASPTTAAPVTVPPDAASAAPVATVSASVAYAARSTGVDATPAGVPPVTARRSVGIVPVRIEIPAIGVDARTVDLDLTGAEPEVPSDFDDTGWYTRTRKPGEVGPAVIAGHVDSTDGPAVFFRLDELRAGDEIIVYGADGGRRRFVVHSARRYPKDGLPSEVFGFGEAMPELRLITCGGSFDGSRGHYQDNHVVYARAETP